MIGKDARGLEMAGEGAEDGEVEVEVDLVVRGLEG